MESLAVLSWRRVAAAPEEQFVLRLFLVIPLPGEDGQQDQKKKFLVKEFPFRVEKMHIGMRHEAIRLMASEDAKRSRKAMTLGCCWDR